jgi:hypothetical protein
MSQTATTTAASAPMDLLMQMAAGKAPAKGKKKAEKLAASLPDINPHIDRFLEAAREAETWESRRVTEEQQILAAAAPERLRLCRESGRFESSVTVNDRLLMTQTCVYSAIPADHEADLREAFGADAGRYFKVDLKIALTPEAAKDDAFLARLIEAMGPEFAARFTVARTVKPTEEFHRDYTLRADVQEKARPFVETEVIKANKPSLRIA